MMLSLARPSRIRLLKPSTLQHRAYRPTLVRYEHHQSRSFVRKTLGYGALAGAAGGAVVLIGAYTYYHTSGIKKVVDGARPAIASLKSARTELSESRPVEALRYLRQAAKAYVSYFPGAGYIVDKAFDGLDGVVAAHGPEVNDIISRGYTSIHEIIERDGDEKKPSSALEVLNVIRRMLVELKDLGQKAGAPIAERLELERRVNELGGSTVALFDSVISKTPEIKAKFGEYAEYAKSKSPEIQAKMGEYTQSAKEYALPKASSLYESAKARAPGIKDSVSSAAEKAKNAVFPPKDS